MTTTATPTPIDFQCPDWCDPSVDHAAALASSGEVFHETVVGTGDDLVYVSQAAWLNGLPVDQEPTFEIEDADEMSVDRVLAVTESLIAALKLTVVKA